MVELLAAIFQIFLYTFMCTQYSAIGFINRYFHSILLIWIYDSNYICINFSQCVAYTNLKDIYINKTKMIIKKIKIAKNFHFHIMENIYMLILSFFFIFLLNCFWIHKKKRNIFLASKRVCDVCMLVFMFNYVILLYFI